VHCSISGFTRNDQAAAADVLAVTRPGDLILPLKFLGNGKWTVRSFVDRIDGKPADIIESSQSVDASTVLPVKLSSAGGFAAELTPTKVN